MGISNLFYVTDHVSSWRVICLKRRFSQIPENCFRLDWCKEQWIKRALLLQKSYHQEKTFVEVNGIQITKDQISLCICVIRSRSFKQTNTVETKSFQRDSTSTLKRRCFNVMCAQCLLSSIYSTVPTVSVCRKRMPWSECVDTQMI